ncbi:MAG: hypothetical protein L0Z50_30040 [Verrucomicrobiales bacterium]|nr:hypothetical protein [Verrucomicrobiales bacterium]
MTASLIQFLIAAATIIAAGAALTEFGDIISHRTKLGGMLVGGILIAGATSLPELAVDINAVRIGSPDLAVGDLLGSSPLQSPHPRGARPHALLARPHVLRDLGAPRARR